MSHHILVRNKHQQQDMHVTLGVTSVEPLQRGCFCPEPHSISSSPQGRICFPIARRVVPWSPRLGSFFGVPARNGISGLQLDIL